MAFDNYNAGDIIRLKYEAGSNPGSTRLVIFRELTDLRHKGPGFKATDATGKTKCFCIADVSGHEFLAGENDPGYTDWYYKVLPDEDTDDQDAAQALGQLSDGDGDEDNTTVATDEADAEFPDVSTYKTAFETDAQSLQEEYAQNKRVAMAAFEKEWETSHQPRLERSIKRARRTQLTTVRTALDEFEKCL